MAARQKEALATIDNGMFDDIDFSVSDDSDNDERMDADCVFDDRMSVDLVDVAGLPIRNRVDPCYLESLLLDDVELQNEGIDSISDHELDEDDMPLVSILAKQDQPEKSERSGLRKKTKGKAASKSARSARTDRTELTWDSAFQQRPLPSFEFHEVCGPSRAVRGCKTALDCFMLYFTAEIWNVLVEQTNVYYSQSVLSKPSPMPWTDVSVVEFQAFIGMIIAMGIVRLPDLNDYWSTDSILHQQWFTSAMSRCRFRQILRYMHCSDNSVVSGNIDKLGKVRTVLDHLNESFRKMYVPDQCLSVDESMVGTKCKIAFLQYMPKKPKKFGIKLWALCESKTGYCLQFQVYTGKADSGVEHGLAYRVVFDLMAHYLNKGYKLFMDNFYSSYKLYVDLFSQGTGACGTVRPNRIGFPKELKDKHKMIRGEAKFLHTDTVTAVRWFDKRDVYAMSTFHNDDMVTIAPRYGASEPVSKPKLITDYNENMNGVDRCDQLLVYYALNRKSTQWWKRLFFRLLDMSIINAMILYMSLFPDKNTDKQAHKKFRLELVHQLVQPLLDSYADGTVGRQTGRTPVATDVRLKGKHFAVQKQPRRRCALCAYEKDSSGKYKGNKTELL